MSGLEERLRKAVGGELQRHGFPATTHAAALNAAMVAGLKVLAEEFGGEKQDAAPMLSTRPGDVLLDVKSGRAFTCDQSGQWFYVDRSGHMVGVSREWVDPGVVPARVLPSAVLTQVRAELAAIADASRFDPKEPPENVLADLRERAAEAVNVLDGEVGK